jgi:uncharacterized protein (UPF0262 family)
MGARAISEILVDDATWRTGTPPRRQEWRLALDEVVLDGRFDLDDPALQARLLVTVGPTALWIDVHSERGMHLSRHDLPLHRLRPQMNEYLEICIEMGKLLGDNSPRLEALDIAKRITHDEAGELVQGMLRDGLRPDHATARRLFTLFVTLLYDTTRLAMSHPPAPSL